MVDRKAEMDLKSEAGPALPHINPVTSGQLSVPMILSFLISKVGIIKSTSLWVFYALKERMYMKIFL